MKLLNGMIAAAGLCLVTALPQMAAAEAKIYAYPSSENYCPAGLQPVTISGVICCGKPNQSMSYQQALAHPAPRKKVRQRTVVRHKPRAVRPAAAACRVGTKGCTFD